MSCLLCAPLRQHTRIFPAVRTHIHHRLSCWEVQVWTSNSRKSPDRIPVMFSRHPLVFMAYSTFSFCLLFFDCCTIVETNGVSSVVVIWAMNTTGSHKQSIHSTVNWHLSFWDSPGAPNVFPILLLHAYSDSMSHRQTKLFFHIHYCRHLSQCYNIHSFPQQAATLLKLSQHPHTQTEIPPTEPINVN